MFEEKFYKFTKIDPSPYHFEVNELNQPTGFRMTGKWITNGYYQELPMECGIINSVCHSLGASFIWVMAIG